MQETIKLYEEDSLLRSCEAEVLSCLQTDKGYEVILDRTVIFPEGGGQPSDRGTAGGAAVTGALERSGRVVHYCEQPLAVGTKVKVELDWERRLDHMQQHCGEHLLSHAFWQTAKAANVGFRMNEEAVFIDLDKEVSPAELLAAEGLANSQIWDNRAVSVSLLLPEELAKLDLRKKNEQLKGLCRVVSVEGGDGCTCCGTHPPFTGMVGSVRITGAEKHRGGSRIKFVCGKRALLDAQKKHEAIAAANMLLSVKPEEVPDAIRRLKEEMANVKAMLKRRTEELFMAEKPKLLEQALISDNGTRLLLLAREECEPSEAKLLAEIVTEGEALALGVFYRSGDRLNYLFAANPGAADCRVLCTKTSQALGGRGGGNQLFSQGSASFQGSAQAAIDTLEKILL